MYYQNCEDSRQNIFQLYPRNVLGKSDLIIFLRLSHLGNSSL